MDGNFSRVQQFRKPALSTSRGIVSAQHRVGAEIGARVLAAGGDCVDAVVATSFAMGVVEPWMSGIGGVGTMVLYRARERRFEVVDFGGVSPAGLDPADYPLSGEGRSSDLFPWPRVEQDRNLHGAGSIAIPGVVAGMARAHERYGSRPWAELVQPAAALAREGFLVDWFAALNIASGAPELRRYAAAAEEFLHDGLPPMPMWSVRSEVRLPRPRYAATLELLAAEGPGSFYEGSIARRIAAEIQQAGGVLSFDDLRAYHAAVREPLAIPYRGATVYASPELTAGPTLAQALKIIGEWCPTGSEPDAAAYAAYARALQHAYRQRLSEMGDADGRRSLGAEHLTPSCTTHFNVVDAEGNMAAVTQTLLGIFGSKFVGPDTGILMNNGIMWFDPEPGKPNSLAPARRCLSNYTPVIAALDDGGMLAVGASGGRRILPAVTQLLSFAIDFRMPLDRMFHTPRIDASEGAIVGGDSRLEPRIQAELSSQFDFEPVPVQTIPMKFACPSAVARDGLENSGATEIFQPWGEAVEG